MKKLSLDVDKLEVQSFDTAPAFRRLTGTVHGRVEEEDTKLGGPCKHNNPYTYGEPCTEWTYCAPGCVTAPQTNDMSYCFPDMC
jgi:hypothetical protein